MKNIAENQIGSLDTIEIKTKNKQKGQRKDNKKQKKTKNKKIYMNKKTRLYPTVFALYIFFGKIHGDQIQIRVQNPFEEHYIMPLKNCELFRKN